MQQQYVRRGVFVGLLGAMFVLGFVSGAGSQRPAQAQIPKAISGKDLAMLE